MNEYFEEMNGNKYLMLVPTNESKKHKKYEELWSNIKDLISLITKSSNDYEEKYMQMKFSSDDQLRLNKKIAIPRMIIAVSMIIAAFHENNKY